MAGKWDYPLTPDEMNALNYSRQNMTPERGMVNPDGSLTTFMGAVEGVNGKQPLQRQGFLQRALRSGGMAVRPTPRPNPYEAEILATNWAKTFENKYGEKPDVSDASNYDYETAWRLGVRPTMTKHDDIPHWASSAPDGTMLKKPGHPTAWKEEYMQATGKDPDDVGHTQEQWERLKATAKKHPLLIRNKASK